MQWEDSNIDRLVLRHKEAGDLTFIGFLLFSLSFLPFPFSLVREPKDLFSPGVYCLASRRIPSGRRWNGCLSRPGDRWSSTEGHTARAPGSWSEAAVDAEARPAAISRGV